MKVKQLFPLALACVLMAAGCSGNKGNQVAANEPSAGSTSGTLPDAQANSGGVKQPNGTKPDGAKPDETPVKPGPITPPKVKPITNKGWVNLKMDPVALADKIGLAMKDLTDAEAKIYTEVQTSKGMGKYDSLVKVRNKNKYRVEFVVVKEEPRQATLIATGKDRRFRFDDAWMPPAPLGSKLPGAVDLSPAQMVALWQKDFPRMIFQGFTEGKDAWKPVIQEIAKGKSGYTMKVQERKLDKNGQKYHHYRIYLQRTPEAAKKDGPAEMDMVVDATAFIPVTIRSHYKDKDGKDWAILWSAHFRRNFNLPESDFQAPGPKVVHKL